jgi:hypothetical protein
VVIFWQRINILTTIIQQRTNIITYRRFGITLSYLFWGQISNNSNYRKKFEHFVKFILMKIRINLHNMEVCAQPIQNL